jgi:phospholipid/cholesterol/gamma-HCH transport system permease protein
VVGTESNSNVSAVSGSDLARFRPIGYVPDSRGCRELIAMATVPVSQSPTTPIHRLGAVVLSSVESVGDFALFSLGVLRQLAAGPPRRRVMLETMCIVGVGSIPVVVVTGVFIGMVLAVQGYASFHQMGMETRIGSVINSSLVKELGPVLAATMLAGRVGSAMAAELGTMRVTEQIDAIRALGANPLRQLVVPRFLACFLLIPILTIVADTVGIIGGWLFSTWVLDVNSHFYWVHSRSFVTAFDVTTGLIKSVFFGGAIALFSCYHGFHCQGGARGVGRAATVAFVASFIAILALDFFLGLLLDTGYRMAYPVSPSLL